MVGELIVANGTVRKAEAVENDQNVVQVDVEKDQKEKQKVNKSRLNIVSEKKCNSRRLPMYARMGVGCPGPLRGITLAIPWKRPDSNFSTMVRLCGSASACSCP